MTTSEEQLFLEHLDKKFWTAADKLRSTLDAAQYKHAVLGLVFLKYVSDSFDYRRQEIDAMLRDDNHDYGVIRSNYDSDSEYEATVPFRHKSLASKDILGHVYEYFLGQFALAEGKKGGQFYTPKAIVTLIVEMLEPFQGRVYDPANSFTNDQHPDLRADYVMANPQGPGRERPGGMHGGAAGAVVYQYANSGLHLVFE